MRLNQTILAEMFLPIETAIESRESEWKTDIYLTWEKGGGLKIFKKDRLFYDIRFDALNTFKYYLNDDKKVIFEPQEDVNHILPELIRLMDVSDEWESNATDEEMNLFYHPLTEEDLWKETLKNKEWNTITLKGVRETEVLVVSDEVFDFITGNSQTPKEKEKEKALNEMWSVMDKGEQNEYGSKLSFIEKMENVRNDNERALHVRGNRFWSEKEAKDLFKINNINIKRKYKGYLY